MSLRSKYGDRPWYQLTAHFFVGLFDFGVLSEAGSDAFKRVLMGIIAAMLSFGLLLPRIFAGAAMGPAPQSLPRALSLAAIEALVIGLPMLVVAFATLLVSHSLFPDETDFRVLLVLPVSRRVVFLSKLAALSLFTGIFIVVAHVAMLPLFLLVAVGGRGDSVLLRFGAHALASLGGSAFSVLGVTAIYGALLLWMPRRRLQTASTAVRSVMLCALVLSLPLVARMLAIAPLLAAESPTLYFVPPAWFLGLEELLLGHESPYISRLAAFAIGGLIVSLALAAGSYSWLYRRFDQVMMRPATTSAGGRLRSAPLFAWTGLRRSSAAAVTGFTHLTLERSGLHQGVFVAIAACGAGLVLNSFIGARPIGRFQSYEQSLVYAAIWALFAMMFAATLAVRTALVLPIEPRANWIFRMTEDDAPRVEQLNAVIQAMVSLGVIAPLAILFPVEWAMFGTASLIATAVAFMVGLVLVELEMGGWRRIPFTCSYMPGKRFVGQTALLGFAGFVVFTWLGSSLVYYSLGHPIGWLVVMTVLGAVAWEFRRRRMALTRYTPLLFEDALPNDVEPLRLNTY